MQLRRARFWILPALVSVACKSQQAREQERLDQALSWVATAGSVVRGWTDNRLPVRYVERTLGEAHDALTKIGEPEAARITGDLVAAVQRRDRDGVARPVATLMSQWAALHARSEQMKGKRQ